jgi:agmatine/peptidylarginine deiminase
LSTYFPAEWQKQWGILLTWPHASTDWQDNLQAAEACYVQIAQAITQYENLLIICQDESHQLYIQGLLNTCSQNHLHFLQATYNDTWIRDYGFITIYADGKPKLLNFTFNAWGNKFESSLDNAINQQLHKHAAFESYSMQTINWILEGGSIETDGKNTLLTTEKCLLNPNRNPDLSKTDIESHLKEQLGIERIFWLKHGHIEGDDTDAHIDTLARFADAHSIIYMQSSDDSELQKMEAELNAFGTTEGQQYTLYPIPLPKPAITDKDGRKLPASYVNFLIINNAVLLPVYGIKEDDIAIKQTEKAFPEHKVIPINCRALIAQNGSLHCITMQVPELINASHLPHNHILF